jgi:hypothetical protein
MFVNGSGPNEQSLQRTLQRYFLPSYGSFGNTVSEEKNLRAHDTPVVNMSVYFLVKLQCFIPELWDFIHIIVGDFSYVTL